MSTAARLWSLFLSPIFLKWAPHHERSAEFDRTLFFLLRGCVPPKWTAHLRCRHAQRHAYIVTTKPNQTNQHTTHIPQNLGQQLPRQYFSFFFNDLIMYLPSFLKVPLFVPLAFTGSVGAFYGNNVLFFAFFFLVRWEGAAVPLCSGYCALLFVSQTNAMTPSAPAPSVPTHPSRKNRGPITPTAKCQVIFLFEKEHTTQSFNVTRRCFFFSVWFEL